MPSCFFHFALQKLVPCHFYFTMGKSKNSKKLTPIAMPAPVVGSGYGSTVVAADIDLESHSLLPEDNTINETSTSRLMNSARSHKKGLGISLFVLGCVAVGSLAGNSSGHGVGHISMLGAGSNSTHVHKHHKGKEVIETAEPTPEPTPAATEAAKKHHHEKAEETAEPTPEATESAKKHHHEGIEETAEPTAAATEAAKKHHHEGTEETAEPTPAATEAAKKHHHEEAEETAEPTPEATEAAKKHHHEVTAEPTPAATEAAKKHHHEETAEPTPAATEAAKKHHHEETPEPTPQSTSSPTPLSTSSPTSAETEQPQLAPAASANIMTCLEMPDLCQGFLQPAASDYSNVQTAAALNCVESVGSNATASALCLEPAVRIEMAKLKKDAAASTTVFNLMQCAVCYSCIDPDAVDDDVISTFNCSNVKDSEYMDDSAGFDWEQYVDSADSSNSTDAGYDWTIWLDFDDGSDSNTTSPYPDWRSYIPSGMGDAQTGGFNWQQFVPGF